MSIFFNSLFCSSDIIVLQLHHLINLHSTGHVRLKLGWNRVLTGSKAGKKDGSVKNPCRVRGCDWLYVYVDPSAEEQGGGVPLESWHKNSSSRPPAPLLLSWALHITPTTPTPLPNPSGTFQNFPILWNWNLVDFTIRSFTGEQRVDQWTKCFL